MLTDVLTSYNVGLFCPPLDNHVLTSRLNDPSQMISSTLELPVHGHFVSVLAPLSISSTGGHRFVPTKIKDKPNMAVQTRQLHAEPKTGALLVHVRAG